MSASDILGQHILLAHYVNKMCLYAFLCAYQYKISTNFIGVEP